MKNRKCIGMAAMICAGIAVFSNPVMAENAITATEKTLYEFDGKYSSDTGYFYVKLENTSEDTVCTGTGTLVAFTENDEILLTEEYIRPYSGNLYLKPGEYIYASKFIWDSALEDEDIADYKFSAEAEDSGDRMERIPCEATWGIEGTESYNNKVMITFTNITDELQRCIYVTAAMHDAEGNLIYVDTQGISSIKVHPESTITVELAIDSDLIEYYEKNGIEPASVDAIVYYLTAE